MRTARSAAIIIAVAGTLSASALADDWVMTITVDNQYDIYFGNNIMTDFHAGGDNNWFTVETYNAFGRAPTDYLYVATASDFFVAQGFIGVFTNTTTGNTIKTGDSAWEVFPAGAHLAAIDPSWPNPWPNGVQPTQSQVDAAIAYAEANGLWQATSFLPGWTNAAHPGPWFNNIAGIPSDAMWIWHDAGVTGGSYPAPYGGANHDEFLIFRIAGDAVPAPGTTALLAASTLLVCRRRRS